MLHSSKEIPSPLPKETSMILAPIRMKPEHLSTALPVFSRIHFGRAYGISHKTPVKSLGLIHAASIQILVSEAETHVYRIKSDSDAQSFETQVRQNLQHRLAEKPRDLDNDVLSADMEVVKDMRNSIMDVLGSNISLDRHPAPVIPLLGASSLMENPIEGEYP